MTADIYPPRFDGEYLLLIRDSKRVFGDNFVWCQTPQAVEEMMGVINELEEKIQEEYRASLGGGAAGVAGDGGAAGDGKEDFVFKEDETVFVKDEPIAPRPYGTETMEGSHAEVRALTTENARRLISAEITRERKYFGEVKKWNDSEAALTVKPQKDPNFNLLRKEMDAGVQAVQVMRENVSQTSWFRPRNATAQYNAEDFTAIEGEGAKPSVESVDSGVGPPTTSDTPAKTGPDGASASGISLLAQAMDDDELDNLASFLSKVTPKMEDALSQNETIDIFTDEFEGMGDDDLIGFGSKSSSNIKEIRNFHDVTFTKGKRIESVQWVPGSVTLLAVSCHEAQPKIEDSGRARVSHVLLWSFMDALVGGLLLWKFQERRW